MMKRGDILTNLPTRLGYCEKSFGYGGLCLDPLERLSEVTD